MMFMLGDHIIEIILKSFKLSEKKVPNCPHCHNSNYLNSKSHNHLQCRSCKVCFCFKCGRKSIKGRGSIRRCYVHGHLAPPRLTESSLGNLKKDFLNLKKDLNTKYDNFESNRVIGYEKEKAKIKNWKLLLSRLEAMLKPSQEKQFSSHQLYHYKNEMKNDDTHSNDQLGGDADLCSEFGELIFSSVKDNDENSNSDDDKNTSNEEDSEMESEDSGSMVWEEIDDINKCNDEASPSEVEEKNVTKEKNENFLTKEKNHVVESETETRDNTTQNETSWIWGLFG